MAAERAALPFEALAQRELAMLTAHPPKGTSQGAGERTPGQAAGAAGQRSSADTGLRAASLAWAAAEMGQRAAWVRRLARMAWAAALEPTSGAAAQQARWAGLRR